MFCRNCGTQMADNASVCTNCGVSLGTGSNYCHNCGSKVDPNAVVCVRCGVSLQHVAAGVPAGYEQKSKLAAGLLGIFLGYFGIHNFYLGNTSRAVIQIVVSIVTCGIGGLWGFIEGILILCGNIKVDANGVPLKE